MTIDELWNYYNKNDSELVRQLGISMSLPRKWRKMGYIPWRTQCWIEVETNRKFIARREDDPMEYERWKRINNITE